MLVPAGKIIGLEDVQPTVGLEPPGTSGMTKKRPMLSAKLCARKKKKLFFAFKNKKHSLQKSREDEEENIDKRCRTLGG